MPDNPSQRIIATRPLASRVLAVAVNRPYEGDGAWTAYVDAVAGISHNSEAPAVADHGNKLSEETARTIFTWLDGPYIT